MTKIRPIANYLQITYLHLTGLLHVPWSGSCHVPLTLTS